LFLLLHRLAAGLVRFRSSPQSRYCPFYMSSPRIPLFTDVVLNFCLRSCFFHSRALLCPQRPTLFYGAGFLQNPLLPIFVSLRMSRAGWSSGFKVDGIVRALRDQEDVLPLIFEDFRCPVFFFLEPVVLFLAFFIQTDLPQLHSRTPACFSTHLLFLSLLLTFS